MSQKTTTLVVIAFMGFVVGMALFIRIRAFGRSWWKPRRFIRHERKYESQENMQELQTYAFEQKRRSSQR